MTRAARRLVALLRGLGLQIDTECKISRVKRAGYDGAWSWALRGADGREIAGSQWPVGDILSAASRGDVLEIYAPPAGSCPEVLLSRAPRQVTP